jgi:WXG100 family type VII secretion target
MPTGQADWVSMTAVADYVSDDVATQVTAQLQQLQSALETLAPQWQSSAASAFYSVNADWQEKATQMNKALMAIAEGVRETAGAYQRMTEEAAQTVSQIKP